MPVNPSIVGTSDIIAASGGNQSLQSILQKLAAAANSQASKTNTSGVKPSPNQSTATISFQNPLYILTFTDPGGSAGQSLSQQAQQAAAAGLGANPTLSNIYHQVQAATSLLFDSPSKVKTYGGDAGSLQTQFVMADLSTSQQWFFRFRTSYDGQNWNQWRNVSNNATSVNVDGVTLESIAGGQFAGITLPGAQTVGFGIGTVASGVEIQTASGVLLANTIGICGPASANPSGNRVSVITDDSINSIGVTSLIYEDLDGHQTNGSVNYLTFGWVANGSQQLAETITPDGGRWVILTLAGGTQIAVGSGRCANGATIDVPAGFTVANSMGVCTPQTGTPDGNYAHGIFECDMVAGVCTVLYGDGSGNRWPSTANWFAIAWPTALSPNLIAVSGGQYLKLPTPSGPVMIGVGQTFSGGRMPLPPGYTYPKCLAFGMIGSYDDIGSYMHGVQLCSVDAGQSTSVGTVYGIYTDGTSNNWLGAVNWLAVAWQ